MNKPLKVFITYSHKDRGAKEKLRECLNVMVQDNLIEIWHDNEILPGDRWRDTISKNLRSSDILLYLVSAASLASKNCNKELAEALEEISPRIIPIIQEACDWLEHQISDFQALPDFGKPVTAWEPESDGWQNVVQGIRKVVKDMLTSAQSPLGTKSKKPNSRNTAEQIQFASVLLMLGQFDKAIDVYSNIIQLDSQNAAAYTGRGVAKGSLERHEEALADFDAALRLNPQHAAAYAGRGIAKNNLGQYEKALADFDAALRLNPQHAAAYVSRGFAKNNLGQHEEAIVDYDTALRLNPQEATAYAGRGFAKNCLGWHQGARADAKCALELATEQCNELVRKAAQELLNELPPDN